MPYSKPNSQWFNDLNVWPKTTILPKENTREALQDTGVDKNIFEKMKTTDNRKKNKQMWLHQPKYFFTAKETLNKETISRMGENVLNLCNWKGRMSNIYKYLKNFNKDQSCGIVC